MTTLPPCAIFDVDGTLADVSPYRHHLADPRNKRYDLFHYEGARAEPHGPVVELARTLHAAGITIVVVTARMEMWRSQTEAWLRVNEVPYELMYMRPDGDGRKDFLVKEDILYRITRSYRPVLAVDDNPAIVDLWNRRDIPVVTWPGWEYDEAHRPPSS